MQVNMQWHWVLHAVLWHASEYAMALDIACLVVACKVTRQWGILNRACYGSYSMQVHMQWHTALHAVVCLICYGSYSMQLNVQWHSVLHAELWHASDYAMALGIACRVVACK